MLERFATGFATKLLRTYAVPLIAIVLRMARRNQNKLLILLVADAVLIEPVSITKFPANREKNREFFNFWPARGSKGPNTPNDFGAYEADSLLNGTGNFLE